MALQEDDQLSAKELELESNHEPDFLRFHRYAERAARKCVQEPSYPCEKYAKVSLDCFGCLQQIAGAIPIPPRNQREKRLLLMRYMTDDL